MSDPAPADCAALRFAAGRHRGQTMPDEDRPYVVHVAMVAAEVANALEREQVSDPELALACAFLHDVLEDTSTEYDEIESTFGRAVAEGVQALTKDKRLPKPERMPDSLRRIREQPREVAMVKLADRITNLQPPPSSWTAEKCGRYRDEALSIRKMLGYASTTLAARLDERIEAYGRHCRRRSRESAAPSAPHRT